MAFLTLPTGLNNIVWQAPERAAYVVPSEYSPRVTVLDRGTYRRAFQGSASIAARSTRDVRAWRAFLMLAANPENTFNVPLCLPGEQADVTPATVTSVSGAANGATSMTTSGWGKSGVTLVMQAGCYFHHAGRAHVLTADASTDGGGSNAVLTFLPPLAAASTNGATVTVQQPFVTCRAMGLQPGWEQKLTHYEPVGFSFMEVVA
jgi:hypothetical protein